ncbi:MAG: winged helix-turn-helix transcriptional regulator [Saprospiraceae bacterium]|jgi:two-component system alkaline phosphatase synthesis response regulator PhoP|nr:winged helix-turn-helix transcriptional regulator [Saprospiraceae bacterium]
MKLIVDSTRHQVVKDEQIIQDLTRKEFQILSLLCKDPGRVYTREQIYKQIWDNPLVSNDRTVDVHIVQLRKKIDKSFIKSIKGVGYKIILETHDVNMI